MGTPSEGKQGRQGPEATYQDQARAIQEHAQRVQGGAYEHLGEEQMHDTCRAADEEQLPHGALARAPVPINTCGCCPDLEAPPALGPFLRFAGFDPETCTWTGSALFVCTPEVADPPTLRYQAVQAKSAAAAAAASRDGGRGGAGWRGSTKVEPQWLDSYGPWNFWRFELSIPVTEQEQMVLYSIAVNSSWEDTSEAAAAATADAPAGSDTWGNGLRDQGATNGAGSEDKEEEQHWPALQLSGLSFHIAGLHQTWRWGFYSCAGFSNDVPPEEHDTKHGGFDYLWKDLIACHAQQPLHLVVGGGDQLYNDDVFTTPAMAEWLAHPLKEERFTRPFTRDQAVQSAAYYFHHYACHWASPAVGGVMRAIPQAMTWDDHDLFDGWGSYPRAVQDSPVFQGLYIIMRRFYLLFQQHTTPELSRQHGLFGEAGYGQLLQMGPRLALALPDQRAERTVHQVCSISTYMDLFTRVCALPNTVTHLVLVATVPVVYPHMTTSQRLLNAFRKAADAVFPLYRLFKAMGLTHAVYSKFDEPELLDDLRDHWSSPPHQEERRFLIEQLQMIAKARSLRVTFMSGDVHLAAAARLYTWPKMDAQDPIQQKGPHHGGRGYHAGRAELAGLAPLQSETLDRQAAEVVGEVVGRPEWAQLVGEGPEGAAEVGGGGYVIGAGQGPATGGARTMNPTNSTSNEFRQDTMDSAASVADSSSNPSSLIAAAGHPRRSSSSSQHLQAGGNSVEPSTAAAGSHHQPHHGAASTAASPAGGEVHPKQRHWHHGWSGLGRRMGSPGRGRHGWGGLLRDHRFMTQVVSSAIVNAPPPDILVKVLIGIGRAGFTNKRTRNKMVRVFEDHTRRKRLLNMRNWVLVEQLPGGEDTLGPYQHHPTATAAADGGPGPHQQQHHQSMDPQPPQRHSQQQHHQGRGQGSSGATAAQPTHLQQAGRVPGGGAAGLGPMQLQQPAVLGSSASVARALEANQQPTATAAAAAEARTAAALAGVAALAEAAAGGQEDSKPDGGQGSSHPVGLLGRVGAGGAAGSAAAPSTRGNTTGSSSSNHPRVVELQPVAESAMLGAEGDTPAMHGRAHTPFAAAAQVPHHTHSSQELPGAAAAAAARTASRSLSSRLGSVRPPATRSAWAGEPAPRRRHSLVPLQLQHVLRRWGGGKQDEHVPGSLVVQYRVQDTYKPPPAGQRVKVYELLVPPLFVD